MTIVVVLLTASASAHAGLIYQYTFTHTYNDVLGTTTGKIYGLEDNTTGKASSITMETYNSEWASGHTVLDSFNGKKVANFTMANGVLTKFEMYYTSYALKNQKGVSSKHTIIMRYDIDDIKGAFGVIEHDFEGSGLKFLDVGTGPLTIAAFDPLDTEVPEPSTLAIFALGLMALVSRRFKKQS